LFIGNFNVVLELHEKTRMPPFSRSLVVIF